MIRATEFLKAIYNDLGGPLPLTYWGKLYYILFYDDTTRTYYIKPI